MYQNNLKLTVHNNCQIAALIYPNVNFVTQDNESCLIQCKIQALGNKCHRNRAEALTDTPEICSFFQQ